MLPNTHRIVGEPEYPGIASATIVVFSRTFRLSVAACSLLIGLGHCRIGSGTDIPSPARILSPYQPYLNFQQQGDGTNPPYNWFYIANHNEIFIQDSATSFNPFRVKAGAPTDSLVVSASGNVGLGLLNPVKKIHAINNNTPTLRLEQDGSLFPAQIYDVAQNEGGFFITDTTHSTTPFVIQSSAPSGSLYIAANGSLGLGTSSPTAPLHGHVPALSGAELMVKLDLSDDPIGGLQFNNATSSDGIFIPRIQGRSGSQNAGLIMEGLITNDIGVGPAIVYNAAKLAGGAVATRPLVVYRNNQVAKVTVAANGNVTATSFITASSRTLKDNIVELESRRAADAIRKLTPVEFTYKDDATAEKRVGFIAEDVPDIVAEPERMSVPVMDVVAVLTRVVKDQQQTIDDQRRELDALRSATNDRLAKLEEMLRGK